MKYSKMCFILWLYCLYSVRAEADIVFQKTQARFSASRDRLFTHSLRKLDVWALN